MMLERVFWDTISRKFERTFELDTDLNPRRATGGAVRQLIRVTLEEEEEEGERAERLHQIPRPGSGSEDSEWSRVRSRELIRAEG